MSYTVQGIILVAAIVMDIIGALALIWFGVRNNNGGRWL
jgi:hypothetical protein